MAGAKDHFPRWQPWVLCALRRCRRSSRPRCRSGVVRWLKKGEPMPASIFPSPEGTALEERNVRTVFARLLAKADMRQICIHDLRHTYSTLLLQTRAPITRRNSTINWRSFAGWSFYTKHKRRRSVQSSNGERLAVNLVTARMNRARSDSATYLENLPVAPTRSL